MSIFQPILKHHENCDQGGQWKFRIYENSKVKKMSTNYCVAIDITKYNSASFTPGYNFYQQSVTMQKKYT